MKTVLRVQWKTVAMLAVLAVVVYQGFLATVRYEIKQEWQQLGTPTSHVEGEDFRPRGRDNAAPLYAAAANLLRGETLGRSQRVNLESYRRERATLDQSLTGQKLAFEVLREAAARPRCDFSRAELHGDLDYIGYRSLMMAACNEMLVLAEHGQHQQACGLARDVLGMSRHLANSPTAIHLLMSVHYAEQVSATIDELHTAFPGGGYRQLDADMDALAGQLEKALTECPGFERAVVASEFKRELAGQYSEGAFGYLLGGVLELPLACAELSYLRNSQKAEKILKSSDDQAHVIGALESLDPSSDILRTLTPKWAAVARRTFAVAGNLRAAF